MSVRQAFYDFLGEVGISAQMVRVFAEYDELLERLDSLNAFMKTQTFKGLPDKDADLFIRQRTAMMEYANVLMERIGDMGRLYAQAIVHRGKR